MSRADTRPARRGRRTPEEGPRATFRQLVPFLLEHRTVLIVDDSRAQRLLLKTYLRKMGHRVLEASSGEVALAVCQFEQPDLIVSDCFIPQIVFSTTVGYRTDLVGDTPPSDICAIFDLETYPGKRSLNKRPIGNVEWALLCDGVPKDEIYDVLATPEGQDQALAKLDSIKDQVVWWSAGADTPQLLADGEVIMGSTYNGRLFSAIAEQDQPIGMLWDAQMLDFDGWIIPEGLPEDRLARVKDFLLFATDTQRLADQAAYISYGPARASSAPLVGKHAELGIEMAPHMPTDPENSKNTLLYNYEFWADYRDDIDAKFQAWLAQ